MHTTHKTAIMHATPVAWALVKILKLETHKAIRPTGSPCERQGYCLPLTPTSTSHHRTRHRLTLRAGAVLALVRLVRWPSGPSGPLANCLFCGELVMLVEGLTANDEAVGCCATRGECRVRRDFSCVRVLTTSCAFPLYGKYGKGGTSDLCSMRRGCYFV